MSRFLDFLVRAYAPLAARDALVEHAFPAQTNDRERARPPATRTREVAALRPIHPAPSAPCRPTSLAA